MLKRLPSPGQRSLPAKSPPNEFFNSIGHLRSLGTRRGGKPGQENSDVMDTKGGLSRACFAYRLGGGPGVASRIYRAPTARIQARKDVDLAVDDVLNRVNLWCTRQIDARSNTHRG